MNLIILLQEIKSTSVGNKAFKNPTDENRLAYTRKTNFYVISCQKRKMQYFANLNEKNITNNRTFWQTVKAVLSEKNKSREKILW